MRKAKIEGSVTDGLLRDVETLFEQGRASDAVAAWRSANYTPLYFSTRNPEYMREALMLKDEELDALQLLVPIGADYPVNRSEATTVEPYSEAPKPHNQPSAPCLSVSASPVRKRSPGEHNSAATRSGSGNRLRREGTPKTAATDHPLQSASSGFYSRGEGPEQQHLRTGSGTVALAEEEFRLLKEMLRLREDRIADLEKELDQKEDLLKELSAGSDVQFHGNLLER